VLNFRQTLPLALAVGLTAGGCYSGRGAQGAGGSLLGLRPGTTTLRIANNVRAPGELERVVITIDGEAVPLSALPPDGGDPASIGALRLKPGAHLIAVRAKARAQNSEQLVVGAQQPFHITEGPAAITIDVRSGLPAAGAAPLAVTLTILGGSMAPEFGVAPADDKDERCAALLPIPRALCRAAVDLDEATRKNDIPAMLCVRDKIAEMRKLAIIGETGKGDSIAMAEQHVAALARQVELCAGDVVASPASDGITVTRPR
jgi:hypothetical protein